MLAFWYALLSGILFDSSVDFEHGFSYRIVYVFILILLSFFLKDGKIRDLVILNLILFIFVMPLAFVWAGAENFYYLDFGLLPRSDAGHYYMHSVSFLNGVKPIACCGVRPLFSALYSVLLFLTKMNLQAAIALMTFLISFFLFLSSKEMEKVFGATASSLMIISLYLFIRQLLGSLMTENIAVIFAISSFVLFVRAIVQRKASLYYLALFFQTLALLSRTGAFFILPFAVLFAGFLFSKNQLVSLRVVALGMFAVFLAFILNLTLVNNLYSENSHTMAGNFSLSLYGVVNQSDWGQLYKDYPELKKMDRNKRPGLVYRKVFEIVKNDPIALIAGICRGWKLFFTGKYSIFFLEKISSLEKLLKLFGVIGIIVLIFHFRNPLCLFLIFANLGIFFSIPFVPIIDAGLRTYASVIPFILILPILGIVFCVKKILGLILHKDLKLFFLEGEFSNSLIFYNISFFSLIFIASFLFKVFPLTSSPIEITCKEGEVYRQTKFTKGSYVMILSNDSTFEHSPLSYPIDVFRRLILKNKFYADTTEQKEFLLNLQANTVLTKDLYDKWAITSAENLDDKGNVTKYCAKQIILGDDFYKAFIFQ